MPGHPQLHAAEQPPGSITVAERVVAKLAARAALELPDAVATARRVLGRARPKASARVAGDVAVIDLEISVRWPASVPRVTAAVRRHVRERLTSLTGLTIAEVRIVVTDLATGIPSLRVR
ncbi:Asp23/Gls24 family envelope stress response protein [Dactylosporangium sp. CA-139114]|uniref:Asp23/Gls24 family envelope stress response protein n=1 Tax=Dactylosporangium sp. CA-139114 TaxID=3239931 RepID=UPI003D99EE4F